MLVKSRGKFPHPFTDDLRKQHRLGSKRETLRRELHPEHRRRLEVRQQGGQTAGRVLRDHRLHERVLAVEVHGRGRGPGNVAPVGVRPVFEVDHLLAVHHAQRQLGLPVLDFVVLPLVLALVRVELAAGVQHVVAVGPDAVDVVDLLGEAAVVEAALVVLHELLEAVLVQLLVLHVEVLVLLHVTLVLEDEVAAAAVAVEVGCLGLAEGAVRSVAVLLTTEPVDKRHFI